MVLIEGDINHQQMYESRKDREEDEEEEEEEED